MEIIPLNTTIEASWEQYVAQHAQSTFCHQLGWKRVVERVFGHRSYYFVAMEGGKITGLLPLFFIARNIFAGPTLISIPFATYGGILADSPQIMESLMQYASDLGQKLRVDYVEFRNLYPNSFGLPESNLYITFIRSLPKSPDDVLDMFPRKARAATRNAMKKDLSANFEPDNIPEFYELFSANKRSLGSPSMPLAFFQELRQEFQDKVEILFVRTGSKLLTSVMAFMHKDTLSAYYSGATDDCIEYSANNFMYYKLMQYAVQKGFAYFDFGRSRRETGAADFKKNQGFESRPLFYQYQFIRQKSIPHNNPSNPKFRLFQAIWSKMPFKLTQMLGPYLVKYLP